ncbi:MAG: hypothetical protein QXJ68_02170 [Methanocellales archaeon]
MATDPYTKLQINLAISIAFTIIAIAMTQVKKIYPEYALGVIVVIILGLGWMLLAAWNIKRYKDKKAAMKR